jgi:ribosomal protein S27AE
VSAKKSGQQGVAGAVKRDQCPVCGAAESLVHFSGEEFSIVVCDLSDVVTDLAGERCRVCGEVFFMDDSAERYSCAGDALVTKLRQRDAGC